jgi:hypothetical protein
MTKCELELLEKARYNIHDDWLDRLTALRATGLSEDGIDNDAELAALNTMEEEAGKRYATAYKQYIADLTAAVDAAWESKDRITVRYTGGIFGGHTEITGTVFKNSDGTYGLQKTKRSRNGYRIISENAEIVGQKKSRQKKAEGGVKHEAYDTLRCSTGTR